jgi:leucyl-tRNA synthetase
MGLIDISEPFTRLFNQGTIIAEHQKMSKSRGNVVNPDGYVEEMGADSVRAYLMFVAPWEQGGDWNDSGISGVSRWLNRVWNLVLEDYEPKAGNEDSQRDLSRLTHQTVKKVTNDLEKIRLNTMIAALMELTNYLVKVKEKGIVSAPAWNQAIDSLILLLSPTAPHLAEELWQRTGHDYSIHNQCWPKWDEALAQDEQITLVVQVNGKLRDRIMVPASVTTDEQPALALASERMKTYLADKKVIKTISVPGTVNFVVK